MVVVGDGGALGVPEVGEDRAGGVQGGPHLRPDPRRRLGQLDHGEAGPWLHELTADQQPDHLAQPFPDRLGVPALGGQPVGEPGPARRGRLGDPGRGDPRRGQVRPTA
ncbi:hypothetical protein, partial [Micromonospora sp. NBS 11-29]|uniref:hypothetical protein n=1 Tax=Micromonospora sp. NBS 11-29 TaxID=1960879 RepID=UPI001C3819AE